MKAPPLALLARRMCWRCQTSLGSELQRTIATRASASRKAISPEFFVSAAPAPSRKGTATATATAVPASFSSPAHKHDVAELRRRRRDQARNKRRSALAAEFAQATGNPDVVDNATTFPPDASALLGQAAARAPASSVKRRLSALLSLSKPRLTVLVVLTAMASYALYPSPYLLSTALTETPSLSPLTLLFLTSGTALCSASANALNMLYEPKTDAMMTRTRNRPLVRALLSKGTAVAFAAACALLGTAGLYLGVNPTVSFLAAANVVLYAGIYTPMKRLSTVNTWVGAVVGGIPPLMGWAAAAGESATGDGSWRELLFNFPHVGMAPSSLDSVSSSGGWLLAALLFAWQFPHFMALSWPIRDEYKNAGLRMMCWVNPARNSRVALRYSLVLFPICLGLCWTGITEWTFAATSLPVNGWLAWQAARFWSRQGYAGTARGLFWASVWHLPVVMVLALLQKKDLWGRVWSTVMTAVWGEDQSDDEHEWEYLDEKHVNHVGYSETATMAEKS